MSTPATATETGKVPMAASMIRLDDPAEQVDRRPLLQQGDHQDVAEAAAQPEHRDRGGTTGQPAEVGHGNRSRYPFGQVRAEGDDRRLAQAGGPGDDDGAGQRTEAEGGNQRAVASPAP